MVPRRRSAFSLDRWAENLSKPATHDGSPGRHGSFQKLGALKALISRPDTTPRPANLPWGSAESDELVVAVFRRFKLREEDAEELMHVVRQGGVLSHEGVGQHTIEISSDM